MAETLENLNHRIEHLEKVATETAAIINEIFRLQVFTILNSEMKNTFTAEQIKDLKEKAKLV